MICRYIESSKKQNACLNTRGEIMEQRKQVTEGIWMLAIYILLLLVTLMIPILSIFSVFFLPIPFVLYSRHFNIKVGFLILVRELVFYVFVIFIFSFP